MRVLSDEEAKAHELALFSQSAQWKPFFGNKEAFVLEGYEYLPLGLPRAIEPAYLELGGFYQKTPFFREVGEITILPNVMYLLFDALTCEFQPYQRGNRE